MAFKKGPSELSRIRPIGVDVALLKHIGVTTGSVAEDFKLHRQMAKVFTARREMDEKGQGIDWGATEVMAYGSLLLEGNYVRITGQDVQRGTFSHRHAAVKDQNGTRGVHSFESYKYCQAHPSPRNKWPLKIREQVSLPATPSCQKLPNTWS